MIANYTNQKALMQARLDEKTCETMLSNIIRFGTSCSTFESEVIVEKAKEVFCIGEYSERRVLQPGQMVWLAVSSKEPAGKAIKDCTMKRIVITYVDPEDDEVYKEHGLAAKRQAQILRITTEAKDQETYLSQEDLSKILAHDVRTIRNDIKGLKNRDVIVPTRGQQKDIGPTVTHREKAVKLFLEGKEPLEIAHEIKHTLRSVERYIDAFARVVFCQKQIHNTLQTALVVGISVSQVNTYLGIKEEYIKKDSYKKRLEDIETKGKAYWDDIDFKKNALQKERSPK